jgi:four helix bundle protein
MRDFRGLRVWQEAHRLTLAIYSASSRFPVDERYGLTSQMRRAASSIPTNIAEACGRRGDADQSRFFQFAMGSACEVEYQLLLALDLQILTEAQCKPLSQMVVDVKRMLSGLTGFRMADGGRRKA